MGNQNNQRKAFLDMLAGVVGGTDNGRQENQKSWLIIIVGRKALLITPITLANLSR